MKALVRVDPEKFVPKFTVRLAAVEKMGAGHRPAFSVEMVEAELSMEARELITAPAMAANMKPRAPGGMRFRMSTG